MNVPVDYSNDNECSTVDNDVLVSKGKELRAKQNYPANQGNKTSALPQECVGDTRTKDRCKPSKEGTLETDEKILQIIAELLIMSCLHILGLAIPLHAIEHNSNISSSEHYKFFHTFIDRLYSIKEDSISLPKSLPGLKKHMERYKKLDCLVVVVQLMLSM